MRRPIRLRVMALALAALTAGACEDTTPPATPTPTPAPTTTDTFTGTLNMNGAATFSFVVQAAGTVTATLKTVSDSTIAIGLALGTWNGTACQIVIANDNALQGAIVVGSASGLGNLCARVYDVGKVLEPVTFEITVVHP